jgi:hypothetical protein
MSFSPMLFGNPLGQGFACETNGLTPLALKGRDNAALGTRCTSTLGYRHVLATPAYQSSPARFNYTYVFLRSSAKWSIRYSSSLYQSGA